MTLAVALLDKARLRHSECSFVCSQPGCVWVESRQVGH